MRIRPPARRHFSSVAARLLGAVCIPLLLAGFLAVPYLVQLHRQTVLAETVQSDLDSLVALVRAHDAILQERATCSTPGSRPASPTSPEETLAARAETDQRLNELSPSVRPIVPGDFAVYREQDDLNAVKCSVIQGGYDSLAGQIQHEVTAVSERIAVASVEVDATDITRYVATLQAAVTLSTVTQQLEAQLLDYYQAVSFDRVALRSKLAATNEQITQATEALDQQTAGATSTAWDAAKPTITALQWQVNDALEGQRTPPEEGPDDPYAGTQARFDAANQAVAHLPTAAAEHLRTHTIEHIDEAVAQTRRLAAIAFALLIFSLVSSFYFARTILRSTSRFTALARRVGEGELDVPRYRCADLPNSSTLRAPSTI